MSADLRAAEAALLRQRAALLGQVAETDLALASLREAAPDPHQTVIEAGPGLVTRRQMLTRLGKSQSWVERCYADGFPRGRRIGRGRSLWWSWPEIGALTHEFPAPVTSLFVERHQ